MYGASVSDPFGNALAWLAQSLTGTLASSIAIIVIALLGFSLLTGRTEFHRAGNVVMGCFLIFGAQTLAFALGKLTQPQAAQARMEEPSPPMPPVVRPRPADYDPYAGASVPIIP